MMGQSSQLQRGGIPQLWVSTDRKGLRDTSNSTSAGTESEPSPAAVKTVKWFDAPQHQPHPQPPISIYNKVTPSPLQLPSTTPSYSRPLARRPSTTFSILSSNSSSSSTESTPPSPNIDQSLPTAIPPDVPPKSVLRVRVRTLNRRSKQPNLRRCTSPTSHNNLNLRDICRMQSEEHLRDLYESQTLAYLNDAIQF